MISDHGYASIFTPEMQSNSVTLRQPEHPGEKKATTKIESREKDIDIHLEQLNSKGTFSDKNVYS